MRKKEAGLIGVRLASLEVPELHVEEILAMHPEIRSAYDYCIREQQLECIVTEKLNYHFTDLYGQAWPFLHDRPRISGSPEWLEARQRIRKDVYGEEYDDYFDE